jgi:hypothetical protein
LLIILAYAIEVHFAVVARFPDRNIFVLAQNSMSGETKSPSAASTSSGAGSSSSAGGAGAASSSAGAGAGAGAPSSASKKEAAAKLSAGPQYGATLLKKHLAGLVLRACVDVHTSRFTSRYSAELNKSTPSGVVSVGLKDDSNIYEWICMLEGPEGTD